MGGLLMGGLLLGPFGCRASLGLLTRGPLMELADLQRRCLRRLQVEAPPERFEHTLMICGLAEEGASRHPLRTWTLIAPAPCITTLQTALRRNGSSRISRRGPTPMGPARDPAGQRRRSAGPRG